MTIEELYDRLGGSFEKVCGRLPGRQFVERFMTKYLTDDSAEHLLAAVRAGDEVEAYRYAMALKGVAGNLGFEDLEKAAAELAHALRERSVSRNDKALAALAEKVEGCHLAAVKTIRLYMAEN